MVILDVKVLRSLFSDGGSIFQLFDRILNKNNRLTQYIEKNSLCFYSNFKMIFIKFSKIACKLYPILFKLCAETKKIVYIVHTCFPSSAPLFEVYVEEYA